MRWIPIPTSEDPVKVIPSTPGWFTNAAPASGPDPVTTWNAPAGTPAAARIRASSSPISAPWFDGFSTTVLPATSAAPTGPAASAIGKLNGLITAHTP